MIAKKILWILVSCLMVLSLVIASCGTKEEEETKVTEEGGQVITSREQAEEIEEKEVATPMQEMVKVTLTKLNGTTVEKMVEKPKYGGTFAPLPTHPISGFDPFAMHHVICGTTYNTNQMLICGDWSKGPAGTGETTFLYSFGGRMELMTGWLAESWDFPDDQTMIFHIRKGVHWWNKPPVNGRELTADDVVWTIDTAFSSPKCHFYSFTVAGKNPTSVKALDKYTVEVKLPPGVLGEMICELGGRLYIFPANIKEQVDLNDWENAIGTGAWMLTDYVPQNSVTFTRNPDYWQKDPLFPENQLPYPDKMVNFIIPDLSTQQAAFRTGKVDILKDIMWEDFEQFIKQNPQLQYTTSFPDMPSALTGRVDKPPFDDIRVRQALNMAINKQEIIDAYYGGRANMLNYPCPPAPEFEIYYIPLEEQPESVQELFVYNPEKAIQLLTDAGYPDGFKTIVQTTSTSVDYLSLIREYFLKVGVDMEIEVLDSGVLSGITIARTHKAMLMTGLKTSLPWRLMNVINAPLDNKSMWEPPRVLETITAVNKVFGRDDAEVGRLIKEVVPFILEQAPYIWLPAPYYYTMWWPWVNNFHGEQDIGYAKQYNQRTFTWIDEDLKKSMGY